MKYLINGNYKNDTLLKLILLLGLIFILIFWVTNILLFAEKMGFSYKSVVNYYMGDEEFRAPLSYLGLLEVTHFHLFSFALFLIMLNHLMLFTRISFPVKMALIVISFVSAAMNMGAGWLIRFVSPAFAYLKIYSFLIFQVSTLLSIIFSFVSLKNRGCSKTEDERINAD
jgi:hypothetical protein